MYTGYKSDRDYQIHCLMDEYQEAGRWELGDKGIEGQLIYYSLIGDIKKFEEVWNKHIDNKVDSE